MRNMNDKIFSFLEKAISRTVIYATCVSARRVAIGNYIEKTIVDLIFNHMQVAPLLLLMSLPALVGNDRVYGRSGC